MEREFLIKPVKFQLRLGKFVIVPFHFRYFFEKYNFAEILFVNRMKGLNDLFDEYQITIDSIPKEAQAQFSENLNKAKNQAKIDIEQYLPILYNQALVTIVTVFDVFLSDSLEVITNKQPNLIKTLADEKDITIRQIVDAADYQSIFELIQSKVLKRFDYKSIDEKITALKKMGVDVDEALSFKVLKEEVRQRFPNGLQFLIKYYDQRHDVVHRDKHVISTYEELEGIADFFENLLLSFGLALGKHFQIETDFDLMIDPLLKVRKANP